MSITGVRKCSTRLTVILSKIDDRLVDISTVLSLRFTESLRRNEVTKSFSLDLVPTGDKYIS